MKFTGTSSPGTISNITYENIVIDNPEQWAIWIGPAQQSDSSRPCAAHPCSLCWPQWSAAKCYAPPSGTYENIMLRNITINNPPAPAPAPAPTPTPTSTLVTPAAGCPTRPDAWVAFKATV